MAPKPSREEIASKWRREVVSTLSWVACDSSLQNLAQGEAGGFLAKAEGFPRTAYLKPTKAHRDESQHARAAREKIAADLAHDLDLPVPPAVLARRQSPPPGCTECVVVSLVMYQRQWAWREMKEADVEETPFGAAFASLLARCSGMLAFDTWLDQTDHGDHPDNIILGYNPKNLAESSLLFLDYANALGFRGQWKDNGWESVNQAKWPRLLLKYADQATLDATVERIESISDQQIEEVVTRIPEAYLSSDQVPILCEGLIGRKPLIRPAVKRALDS